MSVAKLCCVISHIWAACGTAIVANALDVGGGGGLLGSEKANLILSLGKF